MESNQTTWENIYNEFQNSVGDALVELYVLSEYDVGGTFLVVSPAFTDLDIEEKERWLADIIISVVGECDSDSWLGNILTPTELVKLSDHYPIQTDMLAFTERVEAIV